MKKFAKAVKFGGSLFTKKDARPENLDDLIQNPNAYINYSVVRRAARETLKAVGFFKSEGDSLELWLSHGAGPYGHFVVHRIGVIPEVCNYVNFLNKEVVTCFNDEGLKVKPVDLSKVCFWDVKRNEFNFDKVIEVAKEIIGSGYFPMAYGTVVPADGGHKIISADDLVGLVDKLGYFDDAILFIDVDLSDADPKKSINAKPLKKIRSSNDIPNYVDGVDKTGGLPGKIRKLEPLAKKGIRCQVVNGNVEGNIYNALIGKYVGTLIIK